LARDQEGKFTDLFNGFHYFGKTFVLNFFIIVFTVLWFLLLIIPGFIAILRYSMAYYILNDNPELRPLEAIDLSKKMMYGYKGRLFLLGLSFIGWLLLSIITLGIGFLYTAPYFHATLTNFYEDLKSSTLMMLLLVKQQRKDDLLMAWFLDFEKEIPDRF
jgi:uncharacterized membrane protein